MINLTFENYDFWNPLTFLTVLGIVLAVTNSMLTRRMGSAWDVWAYAASYVGLAVAIAFGYVILSEVGEIPRLGQIVTYVALDLCMIMKVVVTLRHAGPLKEFLAEIKPDVIKPLDKIPDALLKIDSPKEAVDKARSSADDPPSKVSPVL